jgi:hypothetical protein
MTEAGVVGPLWGWSVDVKYKICERGSPKTSDEEWEQMMREIGSELAKLAHTDNAQCSAPLACFLYKLRDYNPCM